MIPEPESLTIKDVLVVRKWPDEGLDNLASLVEQMGKPVIVLYGTEGVESYLAEEIARMFHEAYEELAPQYGYRTREASAKPWAEVPEQNRNLMIATVQEVLRRLGNRS